jgi:hypothetical protein
MDKKESSTDVETAAWLAVPEAAAELKIPRYRWYERYQR